MNLAPSITLRAWIVIPFLAAGFLCWGSFRRIQRVEYVTHVVSSEAAVSSDSPTGYAGGIRNLIVPVQNYDSFHWIAQTQQMFSRGEWRVRQIDYENAPLGREVFTPSPYRWWLGLIAWFDHSISGRPLGLSVEKAALYADPLLHIILFGLAVVLTAWRFGAFPATLLSLGLAFLFPFAAGYTPGIPDDKTLSRTCAFLSMLILLAGTRPAHRSSLPANQDRPLAGRWFFTAGIVGGFGLWISVADQVPVILGIAFGALLAACVLRRDKANDPASIISPDSWLLWALGGAASTAVFYLVEYYPGHLGLWRLKTVHPLYSLAWLGLGSALALATAWIHRMPSFHGIRLWAGAVFALTSLAVVPVLMWQSKDPGFLAVDGWSFRLTRLAGSPEATSLSAWLKHDGISAMTWAALLPLLLILPAGWLLLRRGLAGTARVSLALALGPVVIGLGFACWQLGRWSTLDVLLLTLLLAVTVALGETTGRRATYWVWSICLGLILAPGAFQLLPPTGSADKTPLNDAEVSALIARDLAHWLAKHSLIGKTNVLAAPNETTTTYYYGGLPGIGTLSWENQAALGAAARIFSATTAQEALLRIQRREVTHIVVPSWDRYLDEYVRLGAVKAEDAFLSGLRNWAPLPWLRPMPYKLPAVPGYEGQSVAIFEVVDQQSEVTVLTWQAEYFAEMGQLEYAAAVSQSLQRFPANLSALIARAQVAMTRRDGAGFAEALKALTPKLTAGADRNLPWDRRVSLVAVLAQGREMDLARGQVRRCLEDINEQRLRALPTTSLYRLLLIANKLSLRISDPSLQALARDLIPPESRNKL